MAQAAGLRPAQKRPERNIRIGNGGVPKRKVGISVPYGRPQHAGMAGNNSGTQAPGTDPSLSELGTAFELHAHYIDFPIPRHDAHLPYANSIRLQIKSLAAWQGYGSASNSIGDQITLVAFDILWSSPVAIVCDEALRPPPISD